MLVSSCVPCTFFAFCTTCIQERMDSECFSTLTWCLLLCRSARRVLRQCCSAGLSKRNASFCGRRDVSAGTPPGNPSVTKEQSTSSGNTELPTCFSVARLPTACRFSTSARIFLCRVGKHGEAWTAVRGFPLGFHPARPEASSLGLPSDISPQLVSPAGAQRPFGNICDYRESLPSRKTLCRC